MLLHRRCGLRKSAQRVCHQFSHPQCSTNVIRRKKLSIETKRQQRPALPSRKSTGGSFKQPYTADATSPSGYLTPVTPHERRLIHSAGPSYHHSRQDILGSPIPTSRSSVYSPDSTSPTVSLSRKSSEITRRWSASNQRTWRSTIPTTTSSSLRTVLQRLSSRHSRYGSKRWYIPANSKLHGSNVFHGASRFSAIVVYS